MATRKLEVLITGDSSSLERALGKTQDKGNSLAKTLGKAGVAGAVVGLGAAVKLGFDEFNQAQKVTAQTNAVLKSTGNVANTSTASIQKMSESMMKKSGVDDEAIQSGANLLLTFTKVRNEVGKGNDLFNQATAATLDLSVAMGKDMQSSAILVGKALNDPIKGMGALARAGVQFDDAQKNAIKTMVATGDVAGAQKMILKELETQFGGSAEAAGNTFGGQINVAKESLLNLAGDGIAKAGPALGTFATKINDDVIPVIRRFYNWFNDNVIPVLRNLAQVARETWDGIKQKLQEHEPEIKRILGAVESVVTTLGTTLLWLIQNVWIPVVGPVFTTAIPYALGFTIAALDKVVLAITGVKTGIVWFGEHAAGAVKSMWNAAKEPLGKIEDAFDVIADAVGKVVSAVKWLAEHGGGAIGKVAGAIGAVTGKFGDGGGGTIGPVLGGIDLKGSRPEMLPFAISAQQLGLRVSSGLRPGAMTKNGTPSDHGTGKALDLVGSPTAMAAYFRALIGNRGVKQAFYDPLGSIFGGALNSYREGGHSDHVHVATYDDAMRRSRWLMPGLNVAYNGTGRPEPVGIAGMGAAVINVYVSGSVTTAEDLVTAVRDGLNRQAYRQGGTVLT